MAGAGTFPGAMAAGGEGGGQRRPERRETGQLPRLSSLASGGLEFTGAILAGLFVGHWLDRRWGTGPWLVMVGVFVGAGAGFFSLYRSLTGGAKGPRTPDGAARGGATPDRETRDGDMRGGQ